MLQIQQQGRGCRPVAFLWSVGIKQAHGARRIAGDIEQLILVVVSGGRVGALKIPALRVDEMPLRKVFRIPVAQRAGDEHVVVATTTDLCRVGAGPIRYILVGFSDLIGVIQIQWIAERRRSMRTRFGFAKSAAFLLAMERRSAPEQSPESISGTGELQSESSFLHLSHQPYGV